MAKKGNKNVNATEVASVEVETVVADETATVIDGNVLETATETAHVCKTAGCDAVLNFDENGVPNFSPIASTGGFAPNCKPCNVEISKAWTSKPEVAAMRKRQALARQMQKAGIPAIVPIAKGYDENAPIMTTAYLTSETGEISIFTEGQDIPEGSVLTPSVNAEELYAVILAEREARKVNRVVLTDEQKEANRLERERVRQEKALKTANEAREKREAKDRERNEKALAALKASSATMSAVA